MAAPAQTEAISGVSTNPILTKVPSVEVVKKRDVVIQAFCLNCFMPGVCIYLPAANSEVSTMHAFTKSYRWFIIVPGNF